jgi:hypothetical protein
MKRANFSAVKEVPEEQYQDMDGMGQQDDYGKQQAQA